MNSRATTILRDLRGLRLALYDEALAAGPRGLTRPELLAATDEEAQRMGQSGPAHATALGWLIEQGLIVEYQAGRYRAIDKEAALRGEQPDMNHNLPAQPTAQLRTPPIEAKRSRSGQLAFL